MTDLKEATDPPNTLLGLGPPEPPEPSIVVNLAKTDTKDASVVTVRAWSTSSSDYDALTSAPYDDDDLYALSFATRRARRGVALAALGALTFAGAFALTSTFRRPIATHTVRRELSSPRAAARPPATTVLVGGPWVLRAGEAAEDAASEAPDFRGATELPGYIARSAAASDAPSRRAFAANGAGRVASAPPVDGAPASDPDRIRAVADAVELEDDEGIGESQSAEPR